MKKEVVTEIADDSEKDQALQELSVSVCQLHKKLEDISVRLDVNEIGKL